MQHMPQMKALLQDKSRFTVVQKMPGYPTSFGSETKIHDYSRILEQERIRSYVIHVSVTLWLPSCTQSVNHGQLSRLSNSLAFRISSTHEILDKYAYLQHPTPVSENDRPSDTIVVLPVYRTATLLFQSYESDVDYLCHILHIPTVRSLIKTFYMKIHKGESVLPGQAALLLSIFALAAYFYEPSNNSEVATTKEDAVHLSKILSRGALDVLDNSRRNTSGTLEDVQAYIFMSFVTYHLDGFSARGRLLSTAALAIARELGLHRLDADNELSVGKNEISGRSLIEREVKRRVFWQIASTDWYARILFAFQIPSFLTALAGYFPPFLVPKKACTSSTRTI
jgi:hypothetical protein